MSTRPENLTRIGFAALASMKSLRELPMSYTDSLDDEMLSILAGPGRLEVLHLSRSTLAGRGLAELPRLRGLREFAIRGNRIPLPADAFRPLAQMRSLRLLMISASGFADEHLRVIADVADLERLSLSDAPVTDAGLAHLASRCRKLVSLRIANAGITDASLQPLLALPALSELGQRSVNRILRGGGW